MSVGAGKGLETRQGWVLSIRNIGSKSRVPLHAGQREGFDSLASSNTKSQLLQRAGITRTRCPCARADRIA